LHRNLHLVFVIWRQEPLILFSGSCAVLHRDLHLVFVIRRREPLILFSGSCAALHHNLHLVFAIWRQEPLTLLSGPCAALRCNELDQEDARANLYKHLTASSLHLLAKQQATLHVQAAVVDVEDGCGTLLAFGADRSAPTWARHFDLQDGHLRPLARWHQ
jgi:hypothetical protein